MADDAGGTSPPELHIYLWTGGFLLVGAGLRSTSHAHQALQLGVALDEAVQFELDGVWHRAGGVVIDTGVEHAFDGTMGGHAVLWIDADSTMAAQVRERVLAGRAWARLSDGQAEQVADQLRPCRSADVACAEVVQRYAASLRSLVGGDADRSSAVDERLLPVLDALELLEGPTPAVGELARLAGLSASRLQHLFTEQVGMPIRRYALWQRLLRSARLLSEGLSATRAAHGAGFADAAHLARAWRRMNGQSPTSLGSLREIVTICDEVT